VVAGVGWGESQGRGDGGFFVGQFEGAAFGAGGTVEDATATFLAHFENIVIAASRWVGAALLLFLLALGRGSDDDDRDW
jgi:hypothetical protein